MFELLNWLIDGNENCRATSSSSQTNAVSCGRPMVTPPQEAVLPPPTPLHQRAAPETPSINIPGEETFLSHFSITSFKITCRTNKTKINQLLEIINKTKLIFWSNVILCYSPMLFCLNNFLSCCCQLLYKLSKRWLAWCRPACISTSWITAHVKPLEDKTYHY